MNYLYNGVQLPALPEWDKKKYPYALIHAFNGYTLCLSETLPSVEEVIPGFGIVVGITPAYSLCWSYNGTDWGEMYEDNLVPTPSDLVWSSHDILLQDKVTVFLAGSEPVPVTQRNPSAMLLGFQVGQAIRRMRGKREPVAYLYNGVELPDINTVWTDELKAEYPYGYIFGGFWVGSTWQFACTTAPVYIDGEYFRASANLSKKQWTYQYYEGYPDTWYVQGSSDVVKDDTMGRASADKWSNYDIFDTNGSLALAASDPIPVYE